MKMIDIVLKNATPRANERGNQIYSEFVGSCDRLHFDFEECKSEDGWRQYDTEQDVWYFGIWVHIEKRTIVTYAEGDLSVVLCPTVESLRAELESMEKFYGPTPVSTILIDKDGNQTHLIDERPKV